VLSGPVHSIARHKWQPKVGREVAGAREGEPVRRSDLSPLYRDRSRISFIRGYREPGDSHGSLFKPTMGIVLLIVRPFRLREITSFFSSSVYLLPASQLALVP